MANYKDNDPIGWGGSAARGAALGRPSIKGSIAEGASLKIIHKPWVDGDYDENGTYFGGGNGDNLYWVSSEDGGIDYMIRARDFDGARSQVIKEYPNAKVNFGGDGYCVSLDDNTLQEILNSECESLEQERAELNDEVRNAANAFEKAVWKALEVWVGENLLLFITEDFGPDNIISDIVGVMSSLGGGAGYLYYMEHCDSGIGTYDGRWDYLVKDQANRSRTVTTDMSVFVKKATHGEWVAFNDALMNRALEGFEDDEEGAE